MSGVVGAAGDLSSQIRLYSSRGRNTCRKRQKRRERRKSTILQERGHIELVTCNMGYESILSGERGRERERERERERGAQCIMGDLPAV